ncbi:DHA2 family efflux MFS transporter permease subunit [Vibrio sp. SS-MA-C1-2]|uniref:DHA2 family efflux MFS transporter permease subunit n=1 Tax=Vibrio sp. SS-MA-C1-2 TaxID=2908646 RepID=UPI001F2F08ED|nr:DHA2 family efflux MFS transporter permease subunit [Vibrio sp. SS-MA-C1-2]UJF16956.1 DHA2 family efflux MFS transporter permease subunit [Vibrio sp. SS-MA-C1-2]
MSDLDAIPKSKLILIALATSMATFMMVLDTSIANVAVPTIAGNLGVSNDQGTWVITAFGAANAISMPMTGFLSRRFGEVKLFCIAVISFIIASILCGMSTSMEMLIFFRVLQGAVSGSIAPLSQSILLRNFPREKHGLAMALWSMTVVVAPILGPILGGILTDNYSWSWIFFINIPVGIISCGIIYALLRNEDTKTEKTAIDYVGITLLVLAAGSLQMMLDLGKDRDWFASNLIVVLAVIAVISWGVMIIWEWYHDSPVVNFRFFKRRNFLVAVVVMCLGYMVYFGSTVLLPLWLQGVMGYTATWSGFAVAPVGIFAVLSAPIIGKLVQKIDLRFILSYGFIIFGIVGFWRATFNTDAPFIYIMLPQLALGLGTLSFFVPLQNLVVTSVDKDNIADAVAFSTFFRTLAGSISSSVVMTLWDNRMELHHARIAERFTMDNQGAMSIIEQLGHNLSAVNQVIIKQAYMLSTSDLFWASGILCIGLIPLVWLAKPVRS